MYKVIKNERISPNSYLMEIKAQDVINKALPGQFVILMAKEDSERIPLTIYDIDRKKGILSVIYQVVGASTEEMTKIKDELFDDIYRSDEIIIVIITNAKKEENIHQS